VRVARGLAVWLGRPGRQQVTPVPGLASTTVAGLARRITTAQWQAVETGLAAVTGRMLALLPAERAMALTDGPVTIDLDTAEGPADGPFGRRRSTAAWWGARHLC
jgi:hypothetical protein